MNRPSVNTSQELRALFVAAGAACLLAIPGAVWAAEMYRYKTDEGDTVVAFQVPPEIVAQGYEILNEKGVVLRVVAPALSAEQRANLSEQERAAREAEEARQRQREWDETLLLRYSTVEDIEEARDRALRDLKIRVNILKGKMRSLKQQVENYQVMAADQERMGNTVNAEHLKAIDDLQTEMASTERAVDERQREIARVEAEYGRDIDRFSTLLDIVEIRRNPTGSDDSG